MGQSDGSLGSAPDRSSVKQTTSELDTLISTNSILPYILYWNTELKKYFKGLSTNSISRASQFIQNLFSGDWFEDGHALDDTGDRPTKPGNDEIVFEKGYTFDGVDDYVAGSVNLNHQTITIAYRAKSTTGGERTMVDVRDANNDGYRILTGDVGGKISFQINSIDLVSTESVVNEEYYNVVATYNGTSAYLYINGILDKQISVSETINVSTNLKIGARSFSTIINPLNGEIKDLKVFSRAITAQEALSYHNS